MNNDTQINNLTVDELTVMMDSISADTPVEEREKTLRFIFNTALTNLRQLKEDNKTDTEITEEERTMRDLELSMLIVNFEVNLGALDQIKEFLANVENAKKLTTATNDGEI